MDTQAPRAEAFTVPNGRCTANAPSDQGRGFPAGVSNGLDYNSVGGHRSLVPHGAVPADRVEFETLISDTSATLVAASPADVDAAIERGLERMRLFFDADRCALMKVSVDPDTAYPTHAAYGPEIPHVPPELNVAGLFPWSHHRLSVEHQPVVVSRLADLPPEAAVDRATWQQMGARSSLVVPIVSGSSVTHLIVVALLRSEREWPAAYVPRLRVLGEMMANALLRAQAFEALRTAHDEVKRLRDQLEQENTYLRREASQASGGDLVVGRSPAIRQALALAEQVAATASTVLLLGLTGTGKERFASFIHHTSPRRGRPMVRVNCSAIPSSLIESELFGREKGAYTGAMSKQMGRFELAHGSTLFLDEIGELPLDVQVKLLRVLQEHTIERLGSPRPIPVDVRIIAATNRDLDRAVEQGHFRSDLFYRLNVFPIVVPALRDRREDIPTLVMALADEIGAAMGKRFDAVAKTSLELLQRYDWPGNVRELRNVLERAMILSPGPMLRVDLPGMPALVPSSKGRRTSTDGLEDVEREHILRVLGEVEWRIKGADSASVRLCMKPSTLRSRMKKLGIVRPS
jgi:formate hydrogenlyase transcriptional activator